MPRKGSGPSLKKEELDKEAAFLSRHGIRPSIRRVVVMNYMRKNRIHPTVDNIYLSVSKKLPSLSRTTVYNILKEFVSHGLIREVVNDEGSLRYDFAERPHAHFKCEKCGKLFDVGFDIPLFDIAEIDGNKVNEVQVYIKGICKECLKKKYRNN